MSPTNPIANVVLLNAFVS